MCFITAFFARGGDGLNAFALAVLEDNGAVQVNDWGISQNLILKADGDKRYDIALRPMEDSLSSSDGKLKIPISSIVFNNMNEDVLLQYNQLSYLFKDIQENNITRNVVAKVQDCGLLPSGNYNMNFELLQINSQTDEQIANGVFNLQFHVPVIHKLSADDFNPSIQATGNDALAKNKKIPSDKTQRISITSNTDWVLAVKLDESVSTPGNFYIKTVSASNGVTDSLKDPERLQADREIVIARGNAIANNENVFIDYFIEGENGNMLRSGSYVNSLKFILREDK